MLGYTENELDIYFHEYLCEGADFHKCSVNDLQKKLKIWYDGFKFSYADLTVFNPISVGKFFNENYEFRNYWYSTATPVMLINQAKKQRLSVGDIAGAVFTELSYNSFDLSHILDDDMNSQMLIQLLYQTGYLTLGEKLDNPLTNTYRLRYPNYEVQISFEMELTSIYSGKGIFELNNTVVSIQQAAFAGDAEKMIQILKSLFASIPYDIQLCYEKYYQSLLFLVFQISGMDVIAEDRTNIGRIDASLIVGDYIYIIECKLNKTAVEAMNQIEDKDYAEKFRIAQNSGKKIIKVAINFSSDKNIRNIDDYLIS
jgi:hypothetical protein